MKRKCHMKNRIAVILVCMLLSGSLGGCSAAEKTDAEGSAGTTEAGETEGTEDTEQAVGAEGNEAAENPDGAEGTENTETPGESQGAEAAEETDFSQTDADMFTDRDQRTAYEEEDSVLIQLNGDSASASSDSVRISGSTITITEEAVYVITGTLDDGMIVVDAPDSAKLQLVLEDADIHSETSAPLYILEADKVFVTLAEGSENTLSNGGTFTAVDENQIDAALFSKQDLSLNGSGSLTVLSPAGHGIVSKDDLVITGGTYTVTSADHGLDANDSIRITGETLLTVDAGKDGIHAENNDDASLGFVYVSGGTMEIEAEGDGISAGSYLQIENGTFDLLTGGGSENSTKESSDSWGRFGGGRGQEETAASETETDDGSTSMKGVKAAGSIRIAGGSFTIDSADDSVHSDQSLTVNGGIFTVASGDDAFHAEETLTVTDGTMHITESYEGLEALHVAIQGGDITLTARDDGLNAAGGNDSSGTSGGRDGMFGGGPGSMGGQAPGGMGGQEPGERNPRDMQEENTAGTMAAGMNGPGMASASSGSITISGGTIRIQASGDGIDANGSLTISGGTIVVEGPVQGDTSTLDYDTTGVITGGTFIGSGASGMAQTFSSSEQGVVTVRIGSQTAGTQITLTDDAGNVLLTHTPELPYELVILSSPDLVSGSSYRVTAGTVSEEVTAS